MNSQGSGVSSGREAEPNACRLKPAPRLNYNFAVLNSPPATATRTHPPVRVLGIPQLRLAKEQSLGNADAVIVPAFSYGDYLRTGAIARFSR